MQIAHPVVLILAFVLSGCEFAFTQNTRGTESLEVDPQVISQKRQLTFVGTRSGEGYFNHDGTKMVFQSEREDKNPFYQIYLLNLLSGETELISTGKGKTTCAWIHPDDQRIMFASTHQDKDLNTKVKQELEQRKSAQKSKYSWSFDEHFDIYEFHRKTKKYKRLTNELGYDAEGSYSPNGQWIAFASNRHAYSESLSEEDAKIFKMDPSYLMSIYIMKADGTSVRRLTFGKGYNGGPFFSADGSKITWRKFAPNGQSAEIWTMNVDGTDQKQITRLGAMSWAPYFHPSGDYLIFTTNKIGYSNFELYIVDVEGKKDPVRVSYISDFDGLPVFSPDGNQLSWTHRNEKNESQIYLAKWDDKKARALLGLAPAKPQLSDLSPEIRTEDSRKIIQYLASEEMAGRATGSPEEKKYTQTLQELFRGMGLSPYEGKSFLQEYEYSSGVELGINNSLKMKIKDQLVVAKINDDFSPLSFSKVGAVDFHSLAFAGYGIVAPANEKHGLYDSYRDLDVKDKWVLVFRDIPEGIPNERRIHLNMYSRLHHKALVAKQRGALGLLVVTGPNHPTKNKIIRLRYDGTFASAGIPILSISDELADKLLSFSGRTLKKWQDVLDTGEVQTTQLKDIQVAAEVDLTPTKAKGLNVIAKLKVPGAQTSIMIGAHGDHLGKGELGSSLARDGEKGGIHFGADDNASGVAGVVELAHYLSNQQKIGKLKIKHNILFAVWSGEEIGLIGSTYFVQNTKEKIISYLNMDMIGRADKGVVIQGVASGKGWKNLIEKASRSTNLAITTQEDPYLPTDSMAFYLKEIPGLNFFSGSHTEYHSPRDREEFIQYESLAKVIQLVANISSQLVTQREMIAYEKVESSQNRLEGRSFRIYLGTIPDYTQEGVKGVRISGTSKDSPAEKAGLKSGDVIVELAGIKIENLYDYVYCLQSIKANQVTQLKIQRQGRVEDLSITPILKE